VSFSNLLPPRTPTGEALDRATDAFIDSVLRSPPWRPAPLPPQVVQAYRRMLLVEHLVAEGAGL
jgi:hypothetical protein